MIVLKLQIRYIIIDPVHFSGRTGCMKKIFHNTSHILKCVSLTVILTLLSLAVIPAASAADEEVPSASEETLLRSAAEGTIRVGDVTFSSEENVSSGWSDDSGWKNLAGQYVALIDYDGTGKEISMDSGTLTLAVAGVNRIGTLRGDCSVQIVGTGIVLIDNIDLTEGNVLSLHPNTALYEEGSAAVFLKQEETRSYRLINGGIPAILDEDYTLDDVDLVVPKDSSLVLSALGIREETWTPDGADAPVTEVSLYKDTIPWEDFHASHDNGTVEIQGYASRLVLGENSSLTIEDEASLRLEKITSTMTTSDSIPTASGIIIKGNLNIDGVAEGGVADLENGGALTGSGSLRSAEVNLYAGGNLSESLSLDDCSITINDGMRISPKISGSVIYPLAQGIYLENLNVSGTSWIGIDTAAADGRYASVCDLGNVTFAEGGSLEIVCTDHAYIPDHNDPARYVEDGYLRINGEITGGTVYVLAGCTEYTGPRTENLPVVPQGYISRVFFPDFDIDSTDLPMNMSKADADERAQNSSIPVSRITVKDTLVSERVMARKWVAEWEQELDPLEREDSQYFNCRTFLDAYGLQGTMGTHSYCTAVEVIYKDLLRERYFLDDTTEFSTENAIAIRILDCIAEGGQGGTGISHTNVIFTGSGVLGGPGTGSASAGTGTAVYPEYNAPLPPEPGPDDDPDGPGDDPGVPDDQENKPDEQDNGNGGQEDKPDEQDNGNGGQEDKPDEQDNGNGGQEDTPDEQDNGNGGQEDTPDEQDNGNGGQEGTPDEQDNGNGSQENENGGQEDNPGEQDNGNNENNGTDTQNNGTVVENNDTTTNSTAAAAQTTTVSGDMTVVVAKTGNGRYTLTVYRDGAKLTSLNGTAVTVKVKDPENITENDVCYAVFDNNGVTEWIPASYDAAAKELVFKTDRVGTFGIARVSVEDVVFSAANTNAPVYRKLTVRIGDEELTNLPIPVNARAILTEEEAKGTGLNAVFVGGNEEINIFPVTADGTGRSCRFETNVTGNFVIVNMENASGTDKELYDACRASEEVRTLITLQRLYSFWNG